MDLRGETSTGALGFDVELGALTAGFGELGFEGVENFLSALAFGVLIGGLDGDVLEFGLRDFEGGGGFFGFVLQSHVAAGENGAELGFEIAFEFEIALGLRRLALEGVDLAGDLFEDVG